MFEQVQRKGGFQQGGAGAAIHPHAGLKQHLFYLILLYLLDLLDLIYLRYLQCLLYLISM